MGTVMIEYLGGDGWRVAAHWVGPLSLGVLAVLVPAWLGRRPRVRWRGSPARRPDPARADGMPLAANLGVLAVAVWIFAGTTQDLVGNVGLAAVDPPGHALALALRTPWLTATMRAVTWLGSAWVLVPVMTITAGLLLRRRQWWAAGRLWAAYGGALALYSLAKPLVHRLRPPAGELLTAAPGWSFPSGHACQAMAVWGMLAIIVVARFPRARTPIAGSAGLLILLVGVSRVYLGAHWPTDVLAGWALGAAWLGALLSLRIGVDGRGGHRDRGPRRTGWADRTDRTGPGWAGLTGPG